jgi:hypothetical protein
VINLVTAMEKLPDSIGAYGCALIVSDVEHLRPHAEILAVHRGLTRDHLAAVALAAVEGLDADLESMATEGPAVDPRQRVHDVRRRCEKRYGFLAYAGKAPAREEARKHLATATLRAQCLRSPLITSGQPAYGLHGLVSSWGAIKLGERSRAILKAAIAWATPAIRGHLMAASPEYPRFIRLRSQLPEAEGLAEFSGEESPASSLLATLCADLAHARSRAEADADSIIADLADRTSRGDLAAFVEVVALFEVASKAHPNDYPRRQLLEALLIEGPERFVDIAPDWPAPVEASLPAEAAPAANGGGGEGPTPTPRRKR